jgi:hypothetical protein
LFVSWFFPCIWWRLWDVVWSSPGWLILFWLGWAPHLWLGSPSNQCLPFLWFLALFFYDLVVIILSGRLFPFVYLCTWTCWSISLFYFDLSYILTFCYKKKQKEEAFDLESENSLARQINSTPTSNEIWMCSPIDFCCQLFQPLSILFIR